MAVLLVAVVTLSSWAVPVSAEAEGASAEGPQPVEPSMHPLFRSLPEPPASIRLWAQVSGSGDGYLTLQRELLPGPYTAGPLAAAPQLTLDVFSHVRTLHEEGELYYRGDATRAAWDAAFRPEVPMRASFLVSTSMRGVDATAPMSPMSFTAALVAEDQDAVRRTLAVDVEHVSSWARTGPIEVPFHFGIIESQVRQGDRLLLELSWSLVDAPVAGQLRQPAVSVHAGSWLDLPLKEPVRVLSMQGRIVSEDVYVQARVGHLFAREHLSHRATQLLFTGPGVQTTGGSALVIARGADADGPHNLTFDWRVPIEGRSLQGAYDLYVSLAQSGEEGPRVVTHRSMQVESSDPLDVVPGTSGAGLLILAATLAVTGMTWVWRQRRST